MNIPSYFHILKIKVMNECPNREEVLEYYTNVANNVSYKCDSGVDLIFPKDLNLNCEMVTKVGLGIQCEMTRDVRKIIKKEENMVRVYCECGESEGYMLVPRSSISNTPLSMANSIGIIDEGYRGELIVPIRCHKDIGCTPFLTDGRVSIACKQRLFQIVAFDGKPIRIEVVDELSKSERGDGGFGSTNTKNI